MKPVFKKWMALIAGLGFLVLGVIGLFLPVLQGVLFIIIGLVILSTEYVWAHRLLEKAKRRFPAVARHAERAKEFALRLVARWQKGSVHSTASSTHTSPPVKGEYE